ncbi:hypothetical protein ACFQH9_04285 [Pseudonocardia lutea]|uniref:Uncharacterized protein n=1 Tax=Pseudonocardia lutea TaxID=2172015 RepID=A0ABW1I552_9PSEU
MIAEITRPTKSFEVLSYPSAMTVSSRALGVLSDALRAQRNQRLTRWRKFSPGRQALLVLAHLSKARPTPTWPTASRSGPRRSTAISVRPLAAVLQTPDPEQINRVNVVGTRNLLAAIRAHGSRAARDHGQHWSRL